VEAKELEGVGAEIVSPQVKSAEEIMRFGAGAQGIICSWAQITSDIIAELQECRVIVRYGIGVDNVDLAAATEAGIMVCNVPDYCIDEVSDHTVTLLLALSRKLSFLNNEVKNGRWSFNGAKPVARLRGQTVGLVAFGRIAQLVTEKLRPFGVKVIVYDPYIKLETALTHGVEAVSFEELITHSDFVSIHCPLTEETQGLFNASVFLKMKPTSYLINTARGPIVNEGDLITALDKGLIAGAGLDTLCVEPPESSNPLFQFEQVIITPHSAWYTEEAVIELRQKAARQVRLVLEGQRPDYLANPKVLTKL
jgi:D-3-phosphoglycerate dehydrogenase